MEGRDALIQELSQKYEFSKELEERQKLVDKEVMELERFEHNLNDIVKTGKEEMLAPLGKGVFVKTEIKETKLLVDVGSNVFVRKTPQQTKEVLGKQIKRLHEIKRALQQTVETNNEEMQSLVAGIEGK